MAVCPALALPMNPAPLQFGHQQFRSVFDTAIGLNLRQRSSIHAGVSSETRSGIPEVTFAG